MDNRTVVSRGKLKAVHLGHGMVFYWVGLSAVYSVASWDDYWAGRKAPLLVE